MPGTDPDGTNTFGAITINAGTPAPNPLADAASPLDGVLVYQRRWNTRAVTLKGHGNQDQVAGTIYARWATGCLRGPGEFNGQYLFGSLEVSGPGSTVTLSPGAKVGSGNQIFLVE